jgi:hypothetical protein
MKLGDDGPSRQPGNINGYKRFGLARAPKK